MIIKISSKALGGRKMYGLNEIFTNDAYEYFISNPNKIPNALVKFLAYFYPDARVRKLYLGKLGVELGENSFTNFGFQCVFMTEGVSAVVGNNVSIAPNVTLVCNSSANNGVEINTIPYVKDKLTKSAQISIEDDVWIGANVTILPGVKIGKCSVIGAGSVVNQDVEPYSIYAGAPAKKIRDLLTGERVN